MDDLQLGMVVFVDCGSDDDFYAKIVEWLPFGQAMVSVSGIAMHGVVVSREQIRGLSGEERGES